jgi:GNAT superfamily N-acetyltransferase
MRIAISDDDAELALFAGQKGYASFYYGRSDLVEDLLRGAERFDTAEWLNEAGEERVAWLNAIEVREGQRGKGLGSQLLRRGLSEMEKRGVSLVFLHAMGDYGYTEKLAKWYEAHGFVYGGEADGLPLYYRAV